MDELIGHPVFVVGDRTYLWDDVILAAHMRGEWDSFEKRVLLGLACARCAERKNRAPSEKELRRAAEEFRHGRDLVAAEEIQSWLSHRGLGAGEWMEYLIRDWLRERMASELEEVDLRDTVNGVDLSTALKVDGLCSGEFTRFAIRLAQCAAAAEALGESSLEEGPFVAEEPPVPSPLRLLEGCSPADLRERVARLARMEACFEQFRASAPTSEAIQAQLASHSLDWIRFACRTVSFPARDMALEALLCAREDGQTLEQIAVESRLEVQDRRFFLEDLDDSQRPALLASRCGDLLGPMMLDGESTLLLVAENLLPATSAPALRRRAEERIADAAVIHEQERRVRWIDSTP